MTAFLASAFLAFLPQEEDRLRDAWPKLREAWTLLESSAPPSSKTIDEAELCILNSIHDALEAAGGLSNGPYESQALKHLFLVRTAAWQGNAKEIDPKKIDDLAKQEAFDFFAYVKTTSSDSKYRNLAYLIAAIRRRHALAEQDLNDEWTMLSMNLAIDLRLKALRLASDATPLWIRRRVQTLVTALILESPYPDPAKPGKEDSERIAQWIENLGAERQEIRENASRELMTHGEAGRSLLQEAARSENAEVAIRAKRILGMGLEPWSALKTAAPEDPSTSIEIAPTFRHIIERSWPMPSSAEPDEE